MESELILKEQFDVTVTRRKGDIAIYNPPMVMEVVHRDTYPTNEEIKEYIINLGGDSAFVTKTYKLEKEVI